MISTMKNWTQVLLLMISLGTSLETLASKAREKALQSKVIPTPPPQVDRLKMDPGFELVNQKIPNLPLQKLKLPPGYEISIFAVVPGARSIALGEKGVVFVGTREDKVYRILDPKVSGHPARVEVLLKGLNNPNGVAYRDGDLYVAEIPQISKIKNVSQATAKSLKLEALPQKFPKDTHHGWKFIRFGPDGWLYVPVGANCNICLPGDDYGKLFRIDPSSSKKELVAQGIRNTVGFDWDPKTKELWFTDNGRDLLGDDVPPDEINKVRQFGENFGYPYCHGKNIQDPEFKQKSCSEFTAPQVLLPAHVAPLGMRFWQDQIIFAEHGSWNRSTPQGYRVSLVSVKNGEAESYHPWIEGWLDHGNKWGRPVDVEIYFDGSILISDDLNGVIYQVRKKSNP